MEGQFPRKILWFYFMLSARNFDGILGTINGM